MSFVKDDSSSSRGVGAVASYDMGSPRRRIDVAREARAMERRDRVMARSTLGRINLPNVGGSTLRRPVIGLPVMEASPIATPPIVLPIPPGGGGGGGGGRGGIRPPTFNPRAGRLALRAPARRTPLVKPPGAGVPHGGGAGSGAEPEPPKSSEPEPEKPTFDPDVPTGGGGGGSGGAPWGSGTGGATVTIPDMPEYEPLPDLPDERPSPAPGPNLLMWGAVALGAWLLLRED